MSARGFTLVEMLVALAIVLVVAGAAFALVNPSGAAARLQPARMDMQQRARVAADTVYRALLMAGAGLAVGAGQTGPLVNYFPPIVPRKMGLEGADAPLTARADAMTVTFVPWTSSQTTLLAALPPGASLSVTPAPNCPRGQSLCGLAAGAAVVVFDGLEHFDLFALTKVQGGNGQLQHRATAAAWSYAAGSPVSEAEMHVYYVDPSQSQLRHSDGYKTDMPVVDDVTGMTVAYFGDPNPPRHPVPPAGVANCLYDSSGTLKPATMLTAVENGLAALPVSMLADGPWCGAGSTLYDADVLRIRMVRVTLVVQAASAAFRGSGAGFANPGTSRSADRWLPDYRLTFTVTPRNVRGGS